MPLLLQVLVGQDSPARQWQSLLDGKNTKQAAALCKKWAASNDQALQVEACKCLANVELSGQSAVRIEGNEAGGGFIGSGLHPEAIDKALVYLNKGIALAPQDLSIHQGRLHVLHLGSRYDDMAKALDASCRIYKSSQGATPWIAYTAELFEEGLYSESLSLLKVLEAHFPRSSEVIGNTGSVLAAMKRDDDALSYLEKAAQLAPDDSIDAWNLARLYDYTGKSKDADHWYRKALDLKWADEAELRQSRCAYAGFVESKLKDPVRACVLQKASCPTTEQTACAK